MKPASHAVFGPVNNSHSPNRALNVLPLGSVTINDGFWKNRQAINRNISLKHGYEMLEKAGNFHNLRMAAARKTGEYFGENFYDEDVYKWLEALGWELAQDQDDDLMAMADEVIALIISAQLENGYLNSYYQVAEPEKKWTDLDFGHELYCAGHLFQAAIAFNRAMHDDRLLRVSLRFADHIKQTFGIGKIEDTCGHPEVEMALVELYREVKDPELLELAQFFIDQRGKQKMRGMGSNGPEYHQDHVPVREAKQAAGHAVRQMYLLSGVADLFLETGDKELCEVSDRLWLDITQTKMYITGGVGSRFDGESFGESYELPPDQCYCETCAAIGNLMWNWRMLLTTGESRFADLIERTLYNGILSSPGLDGKHYFYANPLMLREGQYLRLSNNRPVAEKVIGRPEWHSVACCPTNVMRLLSSLDHYIATADQNGIQLHQYLSSDISFQMNNDRQVKIGLHTNYPWDGFVSIKIDQSDHLPWKLKLRIPEWCQDFNVFLNGEVFDSFVIKKGYLEIDRGWHQGDIVELSLSILPVWIQPNPRIDAVRGCLAIRRGPIVYCIEVQDQPKGVNLLDILVRPEKSLVEEWQGDLLGGVITVKADGYFIEHELGSHELYQKYADQKSHSLQKIKLIAIPYYAWGNRGLGSMRVWIPRFIVD